MGEKKIRFTLLLHLLTAGFALDMELVLANYRNGKR